MYVAKRRARRRWRARADRRARAHTGHGSGADGVQVPGQLPPRTVLMTGLLVLREKLSVLLTEARQQAR